MSYLFTDIKEALGKNQGDKIKDSGKVYDIN